MWLLAYLCFTFVLVFIYIFIYLIINLFIIFFSFLDMSLLGITVDGICP